MKCCQPTQLHTYTEARYILDHLVILHMSDFGANYILDHYIVANFFPFLTLGNLLDKNLLLSVESHFFAKRVVVPNWKSICLMLLNSSSVWIPRWSSPVLQFSLDQILSNKFSFIAKVLVNDKNSRHTGEMRYENVAHTFSGERQTKWSKSSLLCWLCTYLLVISLLAEYLIHGEGKIYGLSTVFHFSWNQPQWRKTAEWPYGYCLLPSTRTLCY